MNLRAQMRALVALPRPWIGGVRGFRVSPPHARVQAQNIDIDLPDGPPMRLSYGHLAKMADGSAVMAQGHTSVLTTAVGMASPSQAPAAFVPLTVDYRQKYAAAGRIPTNFFRRELGVSEREILTARMIDRSVRPLFPKGFGWDTQLVCNLLAVDGQHDPGVLAINAASAALAASNIPWQGPVGAVRVGLGPRHQLIVNPTRKEMIHSDLNLIVSANTHGQVIMLEAEANTVNKDIFLEAIRLGCHNASAVAEAIAHLTRASVKRPFSEDALALPAGIWDAMASLCEDQLLAIMSDATHDKQSRGQATFHLRDSAFAEITRSHARTEGLSAHLNQCFTQLCHQTLRKIVFERRSRIDGRGFNDVRPISCQKDLHQPLHGSSLFQRGQTQVLCTVALDSPESALKSDAMSIMAGGMKEKNFFVHYEFPSFATNEIGKSTVGRRELGHGALAEKGLKAVIPQGYPFTIRLTSEVLESNGSSSMASICGGTLALLDAGVPINESAAGVAMGLVTSRGEDDSIDQHQVLVDILGLEDFLGDMDFKLAGTRTGITALQADIKITGLPLAIVDEAVNKGFETIGVILDIMSGCISNPRTDKQNLPVCDTLVVPVHKRGSLIGPGGKNLKQIQSEIGVQITPSAESESTWTIFAPNSEAMTEAKELIHKLLTDEFSPEYEFGAIVKVKILDIREKSIQVELHPGLAPVSIPLSQLSAQRVTHTCVLKLEVGQEMQVKFYGRDPVTGSTRLSRKALLVANANAVQRLQKSARHSERKV